MLSLRLMTANEMKTHAIRMYEYGGPEVMQYMEVDLAEPGEGEARVRHTAIGLNFIDTYHRFVPDGFAGRSR